MSAPSDPPGPSDLEALFNTNEYFDLSAMSPKVDETVGSHMYGGLDGGLEMADYLASEPGDLTGGSNGGGFEFDGDRGFGGEMLAGEGMDSVSDGLRDENQGL